MEYYRFISPYMHPDNILIYVLALALILSDFPRFRVSRLAKPLFVIISFLFLVMTIFPLGEMMLRPLENAAPQGPYPENVDGIVLLSGDENAPVSEDRRLPVAGQSAQREIHLARLARQYPKARIILSGGTPLTAEDVVRKADVPQIITVNLGSMGIASQRLTIEGKSHNTYENALYSKEVAKPESGQTWLLVTSAFHMPRALLCFEKQGWKMIPAPSDYFTTSALTVSPPYSFSHQMRLMTIASHEYLGLVSYKIVGWIDRLWL